MSAPELVHTVSTASTSSDESSPNVLPTGVVETGFETNKDLSSAVETELGRPEPISEGIGLGESTSSSEAEGDVFLSHMTLPEDGAAFQISSAATLVGGLPEISAICHDAGFEFLPRGPVTPKTEIKRPTAEEREKERRKEEERRRKEEERKRKEEEKKRKEEEMKRRRV